MMLVACQKEVTEVRRRDLGPVAPGSSYANRNSPSVAPTGKAQQPSASNLAVKTN